MYFTIDYEKKVIFGWSAKCGCSGIRNMSHYLSGKIIEPCYSSNDFCELPKNMEEYKIIIIIRNPYERIISGFIDKYVRGKEFIGMWDNEIPLTFTNFVGQLMEKTGICFKFTILLLS